MREKILLEAVTLDKSRSVRPQIEEQLRALICDERLLPGTQLPSTHSLAELWGTHTPTVHGALRTLVLEGLLSRAPRSGTFVRKREEKLTRVALYYAENYLTHEDAHMQAAVHGAIHAAIKKRFAEMDIETSIWIDSRPLSEQSTVWPELLRAAERHEIQAVITTTTDEKHLNAFKRLPVPSAHCTSWRTPNAVSDDGEQFWNLSLRALAEQGCRSIGIISYELAHRSEDLAKAIAAAADLNLSFRDEWTLTRGVHGAWGRMPTARDGYESFKALWAQSERPDGLVVFPDGLASGVVLGILEKNIRVPEELRVVLHRDLDVDMICPLPVTFVGSSARAKADALIEQILKQTRGEPCKTIVLPYVRVDSAGETSDSPPDSRTECNI